MMTCREFVDFLMQYLDSELDAEPRRVFEQHLRMCPPCEVYLDSYKDAIRLGKLACKDDDAPVPEAAPEQLIQAILAARQRG